METMIRISILNLAHILLVMVLHPHTEGQVLTGVPINDFTPRPLCTFQMALANQACAYLPFIQVPPPAPGASMAPPLPPSDDDWQEHEHRHRHGHGHRHDYEHEDDPDHDHDHQHDHNHGHGHRRRHHHHHRHKGTPVEQQCCKWLSQVDDQCVCELLVRLPPFLSRPVHRYSVIVGGACNVTYSCGSRLRV